MFNQLFVCLYYDARFGFICFHCSINPGEEKKVPEKRADWYTQIYILSVQIMHFMLKEFQSNYMFRHSLSENYVLQLFAAKLERIQIYHKYSSDNVCCVRGNNIRWTIHKYLIRLEYVVRACALLRHFLITKDRNHQFHVCHVYDLRGLSSSSTSSYFFLSNQYNWISNSCDLQNFHSNLFVRASATK